MTRIELPISKSIANRLLILDYRKGDPLMEVSSAMPDDVRGLRGTLQHLREEGNQIDYILMDNNGTGYRFLTALLSAMPGMEVELDGDNRMRQRPIGEEVEALRRLGADITYGGQEGFPPLHIHGRALDHGPIFIPQGASSQFISALLLIGADVETDDPSPYIHMTRRMIEGYHTLERDWSAAAFWYEYVAIHGGELLLDDLHKDAIQGDRLIAEWMEPLGVETIDTPEGIMIRKRDVVLPKEMTLDFTACPDLYPALMMTCHHLGVNLNATGTERLPWKESDRIRSVYDMIHTNGIVCSHHDHRIAMAALAADHEVDDSECIRKSYPQFLQQLWTIRS